MSYTFISPRDKSYSRKAFLCGVQQILALMFALGFMIPFFPFITSETSVSNILLLFTAVSTGVFFQPTIEDMFARVFTGVNRKSYGFFRYQKGFKFTSWNYFMDNLSRNGGRLFMVEKNFDGFTVEVKYNLISSFAFFLFLSLVAIIYSLIPVIYI